MDRSYLPVKSALTKALRGSWFSNARLAVVAVIVVVLLDFAITLPARDLQLQAVSHVLASSLAQQGLSSTGFKIYIQILDCCLLIGCLILALRLVQRGPRNGLTLFAALSFMLFGLWLTRPLTASLLSDPGFRWQLDSLLVLGQVLALVFTLLFPTGSFVPRWRGLLLLLWCLLALLWFFFPEMPLNQLQLDLSWLLPLPTFPLLLLWLIPGLLAQAYRYLRASTPVQRQQTKWLLFGVIIWLLAFGALSVPLLIFPSLTTPGLPRLWFILIGLPVYYALSLLLPGTIYMALLRYRIWDIDALINRCLVYAILLIFLALFYLGSFTTFQFLLRPLNGQVSSISIIGSALLAMTLFRPLRSYIQGIVDRRFSRHKYAAARTLAAFSMTMREEVNLEQLSERLLKFVNETMQPTEVTLWLRKPPEEPETPRLPKRRPSSTLPPLPH